MPFTQHPGVLARTAALHRHHFGVGFGGYPGQAAGHYPVTLGAGHGKHPHANGARCQLAFFRLPDRRLRQLRQRLGDIGIRPRLEAFGQFGTLRLVQITTKHRGKTLRGKAGAHQQLVELLQSLVQHRRFAAPPTGD